MGGLVTKFFRSDDNKTVIDPDEPQVSLVQLNFPDEYQEGDTYVIQRVNTHDNGSKTVYLAKMQIAHV